MDCHHTDEWPALQRAVAAAGRALAAERRRTALVAGHEDGAHPEQQRTEAEAEAEAEAALSRLAGAVTAAELLAAHGLPLTVSAAARATVRESGSARAASVGARARCQG
jgi:hypothetical protein